MSENTQQKPVNSSDLDQEQVLAYRSKQRQRNLVTALILGGLVALFFLASIVRLGENAVVDRFSGN